MESGMVITMWIVWAVLAVITAVLYAYRSSLGRDEDAQVFLDEAFEHEKVMQSQIVARINRVNPIVHVSVGITAVMSAVVVAYYLFFAYRSLFG